MSAYRCPHCGFPLDGSDAEKTAIPLAFGLTRRQSETLDFIKSYIGTHGIAPTHAEIARGLGIVGRGSATDHLLNALEKRGRIKRCRLATGTAAARSITILAEPR